MKRYKIGAALVLCLVLSAGAVAAQTNPGIAPIQSRPQGQTYSEWAALWWQWALETPGSVNPVADTTGEHCTEGQSNRVWFLAGSFGSAPITRTCTVPTGTALFFPLINRLYCASLTDPPEQRTEDFVRGQVNCDEDKNTTIAVTIDGVAIRTPEQYREESVLFDVDLPADNLFGLPAQTLSPCADEGYYLFVFPLARGSHTIEWTAASCGSTQDITYNLRVQ